MVWCMSAINCTEGYLPVCSVVKQLDLSSSGLITLVASLGAHTNRAHSPQPLLEHRGIAAICSRSLQL